MRTTSPPATTCQADARDVRAAWPLERVLFALAGSVVLVASALTLLVSPWFVLMAAFAGVNQWLFVIVGDCPASLVLTRIFGLERSSRP